MKNISNILSFVTAVSILFTACSKVDNLHEEDSLPVYKLGTSPVLSSSVTTVTATLAEADNSVISFNWTDPKYANNDAATTKYLLEIDSTGGSFTNPASKIVNGVLSTTLTGRELNAILLGYGFQVGVARTVDIRLISSYANNNERYMSNLLKVTATVFADPSVLSGSVSDVTLTLANAANNAIDFSWSSSFAGYSGAISYVLQYDSSGKGFAVPLELAVSPASSLLRSITQGDLNTAAMNAGIPGGNAGQLEFRIKATTALGAVVYSNLFLLNVATYYPIVRMYLPGSYQISAGYGTENWKPETAPELIRDLRPGVLNSLYYIYIYLPAGTEFKVTEGRSWDVNYGGTSNNLVRNDPNNLRVTNAGFYRISVDRTNLKYDIREGRMGFVGGATGAGWTPPNVFPAYALGNAGTNLFVGLTDLTIDGWKLIDNDQWDNGSKAVDETRSYGSAGASGSTLETNGANFPNISTAGRYRVIWDGRDRDNVKYEMSPATEMRVVGNGLQGVADWSPAVSPQMTYIGSGKWQLTATLVGGKSIKFLGGNDWGAFDYEDNSGGSDATGVARGIKWEGGGDFKTPAMTGLYTITLDENTQTVIIN